MPSLAFYSRTPVSEAKVGCAKCGYVGHLTYQCRNFIQIDPAKAAVLDVSSTSSPSSDDYDDTPLQLLTRGKDFYFGLTALYEQTRSIIVEEINREKEQQQQQQKRKKETETSRKSKKHEKAKRKRHRSPSTSSSSDSESESETGSKKSKRARHHKHRHHSAKSKKSKKESKHRRHRS
ncbi:unnamed protein product [Rotaria socialis]|uniref:CCHC-type domain-containing protein n=2 Tax=Rotaria socialis TaxID=392032 RepID=A0A819YGG5_9BILA|nr:unnamed protein product [Rotaria socialis]